MASACGSSTVSTGSSLFKLTNSFLTLYILPSGLQQIIYDLDVILSILPFNSLFPDNHFTSSPSLNVSSITSALSFSFFLFCLLSIIPGI